MEISPQIPFLPLSIIATVDRSIRAPTLISTSAALSPLKGDAVFGISTRNDGAGGGTVGSLATVDLNAASVSVGGFFQTFVATNGGGSIQGDATNTVAISGDLTAQQGILVTIEDTIFGGTGNFTGGHIGGNAIVTLECTKHHHPVYAIQEFPERT